MKWLRRPRAKVVRVLAGLALGGSVAQGVTATWTGAGDDSLWRNDENWSGLQGGDLWPGHPDASTLYDVEITDTDPRPTVELDVSVPVLTVHVGSGMTLKVLNAGTLDIGSSEILDVDSGGVVQVYNGAQLRLRSGATHTLDGTIEFMNDPNVFAAPTLGVAGSTTITGSGTIKRGDQKGILGSLDVTARLTLDTNVKAEGELDITVKLTNNGTVNANVSTKSIRLQTNTKDGSGLWKADKGKLQVDVGVSGSGDWVVAPGGNSEIEFNAACTNLTGDLTVSAGGQGARVDVNAAVQSTGCLTIDSGTYAACLDIGSTFLWGNSTCPP